jgi:tRNA-Thr(GGU) m(6)t(6)A37 methyltransferase TsaA
MPSESELITLKPIGIIHSPFHQRGDAPRQGRFSDLESEIEVFPDYIPALKLVDRGSHVIVLYWQDRSDRSVLQSKTPFSKVPVGVFASRSPNRPNPIAFCVADLIAVDGGRLMVRGVDALDGSPLLDIKVYSPQVDSIPDATFDRTAYDK